MGADGAELCRIVWNGRTVGWIDKSEEEGTMDGEVTCDLYLMQCIGRMVLCILALRV